MGGLVENLNDQAGPSSGKFIPKNKLKKFADNIVSIRQSIDNENNNIISAQSKIKNFERKTQMIYDEGRRFGDIDLEKRNLEDTKKEYNSAKARIEELKGGLKSRFSQISDLVYRMIGDRGMTLGKKVSTIFREHRVTVAAVLTAIGAVIAFIIESLGSVPA